MTHLLYMIFFILFSQKTALASNQKIFNAPGSQHSVVFMRLKDKKILFSKNSHLSLMPASVTKLVTASAVLDFFSPDFQFETKIYYDGHRKKGVIEGDLIIKGGGDPFLTNEKLWEFASDMRNMNIKLITGNLIIDSSLFDTEFRDGQRLRAKSFTSHSYDAPISASGINFNTYTIFVSPNEKRNAPAYVSLYPFSVEGVSIENKLFTKDSGTKFSVVRRVSHHKLDILKVNGIININSQFKKIYRSVSDPILASGYGIRSFMMGEGIKIKGGTISGNITGSAKHFYTINSFPLNQIINGLNKYSNNYIADVLVKNMGARSTGKAGSFANGIAVINNFLRDKARIKGPFKILNGSGLHPGNRLNAEQIVDLLYYCYQRFDIFPEFLASLASPGAKGTLEKRLLMKKGWIRAKTGTLTKPQTVAAIAGYMWHPEHQIIAFAVIENGKKDKSYSNIIDMRDRQDKNISKLYESF